VVFGSAAVTTQDSREPTADAVVVGVVADPVAAPAHIARQLEHDLPGLLAEEVRDRAWRVEMVREQLPPGDVCYVEMMTLRPSGCISTGGISPCVSPTCR
jgi:hypothetical protein